MALLAFIHFGLGINVPVYFIIDAAAHPDLVARLNDLALLGFLVAAFQAVIIVLATSTAVISLRLRLRLRIPRDAA